MDCLRLLETGCLIAKRVDHRRTFLQRLTGLLGAPEPVPGDAVHLLPCACVHTFGMHYPIDVLFVTEALTVKKIVSYLQPNSVAFCVGAHSTFEFAAGTLDNLEISSADQLVLEKSLQSSPDKSNVAR